MSAKTILLVEDNPSDVALTRLASGGVQLLLADVT